VIELDTLGMKIFGSLEAGSSTCRFQGKLTITLHGEFENFSSTSDRHLHTKSETEMEVKGIVIYGTLFDEMIFLDFSICLS
jgi:hypothetical protein